MNVTCPECQSIFRVDPAKVPEAGVRARCSVCGGIIAIAGGMTTNASRQAPPAPANQEAFGNAVAPSFAGTSVPEIVRPESSYSSPAPGTAALAKPATASTAVTPRRPINPFLNADPGQRARRLARALVSDLVAYHPQKREEGMRNGTLRELFKDEIRKSHEEFIEQVGNELAESSTYFRDALNEILAGDRRIF